MNNQIIEYKTIRKAILEEAENDLYEYYSVKEKITNLFDKMAHIKLNNMTSKEKIDYVEMQKTDRNMNKLNTLSFLFKFIDKSYDDEIYSIFTEVIDEYKNNEILVEQKQIENEETSGYQLIKEAILKEVKKLLNEYDNAKNRILKLLNNLSGINLNNMTPEQQIDYEIMMKKDKTIIKLNELSILFKFIDKPYDDEIYSIFMDEIDKYRNKGIAIHRFEQQVENQKVQRESAIHYFEQQIKNKAIKEKDKDEINEDLENQSEINKVTEEDFGMKIESKKAERNLFKFLRKIKKK